jgi:hypothetical protein
MIPRLYDLIPGIWTTLAQRRGDMWLLEIYKTSEFDMPVRSNRVLGVTSATLEAAIDKAVEWLQEEEDEDND